MTTYLNPDSKNDPETIAARDEAIANIMQRFSDAFRPWETNPSDAMLAREHLAELLGSSANIAALLFSQASTFECHWGQQASDDTAADRRVLVVTPEFAKVADEHANVLEKPQILVAARWERVSS